MKTIIPVGNRVLIKVLKKKTDDEFDLFVPERYATKPFRGEIVALGDEITPQRMMIDGSPAHAEFSRCNFKEGDIVLFKYFTGMQVYIQGKEQDEYLILDVPHIIGKEVQIEKESC